MHIPSTIVNFFAEMEREADILANLVVSYMTTPQPTNEEGDDGGDHFEEQYIHQPERKEDHQLLAALPNNVGILYIFLITLFFIFHFSFFIFHFSFVIFHFSFVIFL